MSATKVGQVSIILSSVTVTTADFPAVDFQAGDLIVVRGLHGSGGTTGGFASVTDTPDNLFPMTLPSRDWNGSFHQLSTGYILAAPSTETGVVFRITWTNPIGLCWYYLQVWRPTAGSVMQVDATKAFVSGGSTLTPITPTINTASNALVLAVIDAGQVRNKSAPLIGAQTANTVPDPLAFADYVNLLETFFTAPQTGIRGQFTMDSTGGYNSNIMSFKEFASTVEQTYVGQGIVVGGTSTNQEVFTGGIG